MITAAAPRLTRRWTPRYTVRAASDDDNILSGNTTPLVGYCAGDSAPADLDAFNGMPAKIGVTPFTGLATASLATRATGAQSCTGAQAPQDGWADAVGKAHAYAVVFPADAAGPTEPYAVLEVTPT